MQEEPCYLGVNHVTVECAHSIHTNEAKDKNVQVQSRLCINTNVYVLHATPFWFEFGYPISHDYQDRIKAPPRPSENLYIQTSVDIYTSTPRIR